METTKRGNCAEAKVLAGLVQHGFDVSIPFGDGAPYDLLVDLGTAFLRVRCKRGRSRGGCVIFNTLSTDHGNGPGSYRGLADVFGVHFPPTDEVYLVPIDAVAECEGRLRLRPARNNQRRRTRPAADFAIDRWTEAGLREIASRGLAAAEPVGGFA